MGGTGGRTLQGHQALSPKDPKTVAPVGRCKALTDLNNDKSALARGDRGEEGTEVMVTGHRRDATQGVGVMAARVGLELTLVLHQ